MNNIYAFLCFSFALSFLSCKGDKKDFQATGHFEAVETIVSAEAQGALLTWLIEEGMPLDSGQIVGKIDDTALQLKKAQLEAQWKVLAAKKPDVALLTNAYDEQWKNAKTQWEHWTKEKERFQKLVETQGATQKQLDDIVFQVDAAKKQMDVIISQKKAQQSTLSTQISGLNAESDVIKVQLAQIEDNILKCNIVNPVKGTVLNTYMEAKELAMPGKALYTIADLSSLILKAYVTGNQLPDLQLGQALRVRTDDGKGGFKEYSGSLTWISSKAEFTPKSIQTKDERADKVYAVKIKVPNDGFLKMGMYGEVIW